MKAKEPKKSSWGGARKGAGRHPRSVKSRFTKGARIDPAHSKDIEKEEGFSFASKLDRIIRRGLCNL